MPSAGEEASDSANRFAQRFTLLHHHDEQVVGVLRLTQLFRSFHLAARKQFVILPGQHPATLIPTVELAQLHGKHAALQAFQPQVVPGKSCWYFLTEPWSRSMRTFLASSASSVVTAPPHHRHPGFCSDKN